MPWRNSMVLATILALLMLLLGGFGGIINASYAMNAMIHNTAWVPGHFHLIFAGTTVIMYFAIAYYLWPKMTGKKLVSVSLPLIQLFSMASAAFLGQLFSVKSITVSDKFNSLRRPRHLGCRFRKSVPVKRKNSQCNKS